MPRNPHKFRCGPLFFKIFQNYSFYCSLRNTNVLIFQCFFTSARRTQRCSGNADIDTASGLEKIDYYLCFLLAPQEGKRLPFPAPAKLGLDTELPPCVIAMTRSSYRDDVIGNDAVAGEEKDEEEKNSFSQENKAR